jgi:hypothetical protein
MMFDDQFPSMKGKQYDPNICGILSFSLDVQEYCLDKQKVRDTIADFYMKEYDNPKTRFTNMPELKMFCDKILKELGVGLE